MGGSGRSWMAYVVGVLQAGKEARTSFGRSGKEASASW
jgi:hypothetical protein